MCYTETLRYLPLIHLCYKQESSSILLNTIEISIFVA